MKWYEFFSKQSEAYRDGYRECWELGKWTNNPHPPHTEDGHDWTRGFDDCLDAVMNRDSGGRA